MKVVCILVMVSLLNQAYISITVVCGLVVLAEH